MVEKKTPSLWEEGVLSSLINRAASVAVISLGMLIELFAKARAKLCCDLM